MNAFYQAMLLCWIILARIVVAQARHTSGTGVTDDQYFHLNSASDTYHFGYEVNPDGNFHHERRGPEGVTYGCYGYINSRGKLFVTHYVADRKGYRVVEPNKPIQIFLTDQGAWQAFLLPKGCGRHAGKPSTTGPELIYKPPGSVSTPAKPSSTTTMRSTTITTRPSKPPVVQPASSTTRKPVTTCTCAWPTSTKPPTISTTTSKTTTPRTTTAPQTTQSTNKPDRPIVEVNVDITVGKPSHYNYRPNNTLYEEYLNMNRYSRQQFSYSSPFYFAPYNHPAPPDVPSTSHDTCGSNFGYIGLVPVVFVPIATAKSLGLGRAHPESESNDIPLRTFTKHGSGNWTVTELLDEEGNPFRLDYSDELQKIINGGDFDRLLQSDTFK